MAAILCWRSFVVSRFYVRLRLCYCYSALCLKLIQTWETLVVTGKDDVSGFSECEIRVVGDADVSSVTPARLRVDRLANMHSLHSVSGLIDTALVRSRH